MRACIFYALLFVFCVSNVLCFSSEPESAGRSPAVWEIQCLQKSGFLSPRSQTTGKFLLFMALMLSLFQPSPVEAESLPRTVVFGNSHMVWFKTYAAGHNKEGVSLLTLADSDPATSDRMKCSSCDLFAYEGRGIQDMWQRRTAMIKEVKKLGGDKVILYEGTNSLLTPTPVLKKWLTDIVHDLHQNNIKTFLSEMPKGVVGAGNGLSEANINAYNAMILEVGADLIIPLSEAPWTKGKLHGYVGGPNGTFYFILDRFKQALLDSKNSPADAAA